MIAVKIHDMRTDRRWEGKADTVNRLVYDASGCGAFLDPEDVGYRFHITLPDGTDVTETYMGY